MGRVEIRKVESNHDLKTFVQFYYDLYRDCPHAVPFLFTDEIATLRKDKNPAFEFCDADFFQDPRNHYDRLVHFSFGVCMFPCLLYACKKWFSLKHLSAIFMAWLIVQTGSLVYELFEWTLTIVMSPERAEGYNGQQGDMWDAQKDMALAMLGSTIMAVYYIFRK